MPKRDQREKLANLVPSGTTRKFCEIGTNRINEKSLLTWYQRDKRKKLLTWYHWDQKRQLVWYQRAPREK